MESGKGSKILSKSLHKIYSNYTKYNSLAKLRIDNIKNTSSKQNITLKHSIYKPNSTIETQNHKRKSKITCKKNNILKTFVFRDSHQSKSKTQNCSLSCSTQKNKGGLGSISKENIKNNSHFSSIQQNRSTQKIHNQSLRTPKQQNQKKTVKLKGCAPRQGMEMILNRTKSVLEGWMRQKSSWQRQKEKYELNIQNLHIQIDILKSKLNVREEVNPKRHIEIGFK